MGFTRRVLLVEHLDATGAAAIDARHHADALRAAGWDVEGLVLDGAAHADLLYPVRARHSGNGFDLHARDGLPALAARVRASRASVVLWAGAAPGGGAAARALPAGVNAFAWPTGHAPADAAAGPLPELAAGLAPIDGSAQFDEAHGRRWLPLWDGPFALVPSLPAPRTAEALLAAFVQGADEGGELDLVVLEHPDPALEHLARRAGVAQRVHFVGPAPREAEPAWLGSAVAALVSGEQPLSGGFVLRALASGCPLLPVGSSAAPIAQWLARHELGCGTSTDAVAAALGAAVRRDGEAAAARARARDVAAACGPAALAERLGRALEHAGAVRGKVA